MPSRITLFSFFYDSNHNWFVSGWIFCFINKVYCYGNIYNNTEYDVLKWSYQGGLVHRINSIIITDVYFISDVLCFRNKSR